MKKHSSFPKIGQFRQVVTEVRHRSSYMGKDVNGDPIYDAQTSYPTITFKGTVKLHGTNAGIGQSKEGGVWAQSKSNVITPEEDNFGFARFVQDNGDMGKELADHVRYADNGNPYTPQLSPNDKVIIFGEWAGSNIQKNVAISQIPKSFFIFDVKVVPENGDDPYHIESDYLRDTDRRVYNIEDYLSYHIDIDFNRPELVQNKLAEITLAVEKLCPVGKAFDIDGIGEGVVWTAMVDGHIYRFKVKGEQHSVSKVKTLAPVDIEKINSIHEFVDYAVTQNRYEQGMGIVFPDGDLDIKKMGDIIRWVVTDIMAEEGDVLEGNGLTPKDVNKFVSTKVRTLFFADYNKV